MGWRVVKAKNLTRRGLVVKMLECGQVLVLDGEGDDDDGLARADEKRVSQAPEVLATDNKKPWVAGPSFGNQWHIPPPSLMSGESARTVATSAPTSVSLPGVEQLPPADLHFTSVPALLSYVETASTDPDVDSVTVASVPPNYFTAIDEALQARGRTIRLFFFAEEKLLIITIPNKPHEPSNGATRYPSDLPPDSSASRGEGDSNGGPSPERDGNDSWPTIVFEAGFSQSLESLRMKMRFWFTQSNHDIKIVILAKA
ncbi:dead deah box dna helicase [Ophiostoma piceae UAMH 11346]|uniref:Dead deah box dna helicase n=1 Tax=Ophiostoma piceae (strain UAMH 11346) TaxID=1262450 RepID=S3BPN7_OPHP1|nr:dead deah box dna helicase [Ophiostoma piceae UAMH 11346]